MEINQILAFVAAFSLLAAIIFAYLFFDRQFKLKWLLKRLQKIRKLSDVATKEISYQGSDIDSGSENALIGKIRAAFEEEKVYLDCNLTIDALAHKLGTNKSTLSKAINEGLHRNFPTLLNDYRIKHALELFNDPANSNYTIEAIAEMSGYNSRQVFHKAFKSRVGVPPRRFRG